MIMAEALPFKTTMQFAYGEPRELAPGVVRIVANNPSPFTVQGHQHLHRRHARRLR
jgi:hypothetical protein